MASDIEIGARREKAEAFRRMHDRRWILVLPNAWDALSARIFESAGFPAIATTSAGVSYAIGYPDGEIVPRDEMIAAIGRIARSVTVPVTADIESGFARDGAQVAELERLGVARVSTASGPARVAMTATRKAADELMRTGSFEVFGGDTLSHQEANALMAKRGA